MMIKKIFFKTHSILSRSLFPSFSLARSRVRTQINKINTFTHTLFTDDDDDDFIIFYSFTRSFMEMMIKKDSLPSSQSENSHETAALNLDDSYANLLKDTDKLKLMLLAWNYQNSAAIRNNASGPDLSTMANLWEQYQNALTGMGVSKNGDGLAIGSPVSIKIVNEKLDCD
jgi:hypothetical protein